MSSNIVRNRNILQNSTEISWYFLNILEYLLNISCNCCKISWYFCKFPNVFGDSWIFPQNPEHIMICFKNIMICFHMLLHFLILPQTSEHIIIFRYIFRYFLICWGVSKYPEMSQHISKYHEHIMICSEHTTIVFKDIMICFFIIDCISGHSHRLLNISWYFLRFFNIF